MKDIKVTIKNYRSIPYDNPITIEIKEGITYILGVNNIGKSNLLKIFYEFRNIIQNNSGFGQQNQSTQDGVFFSSLKNQKSPNNQIELLIETENQYISATISPRNEDNLEFPGFKFKFNITNKADKFYQDGDFEGLFQVFKNSMYVGSFRTPLWLSNAPYFDISVGESFISNWDSWATGTSLTNRTKIRDLKNELKELFQFNHFDITVTQDKKNLIIETDNGSFYLNELGGGIGHFILVLGNALIKQPGFILIDEPENALHPKLQEVFIRTLASKAKYGLIATSHSIGLARSTADKIYSLTKNDKGRIILSDFGESYRSSISNNISELGFSQFMELGGNNILLVEGRTDIKCFKEILRKYNIEQHFIIMDLGGAGFVNGKSLEELSELKRLNANSYNVIFDSEYESESSNLKSDFLAFKENCESLNFNVFPTDYHSTENYLSQRVIELELGTGYTALTKFENFSNRPPENKWGKTLNWKMFREMTLAELEGTQLDSFIKNTLIPFTNK